MFNLVSKSFNFLSPTTTSLVAAEADSVVGLERGVFTPPMAAVASSALAVALGGGAVIGAGMAACATPLLGALGVPQSSVLHAPGRAYLLARALGTPASLALLALQGSFRGARDTATPLRAALIGTALNLALDPLLIGDGTLTRLCSLWLYLPLLRGARGHGDGLLTMAMFTVVILTRPLRLGGRGSTVT